MRSSSLPALPPRRLTRMWHLKRSWAGPRSALAAEPLYLTTQIGSGTTNVNEIADGTWVETGELEYVTVLTVPSLPAGTYYLTLSSTHATRGAWWITQTSNPAVDSFTASASLGQQNPSYAPASVFQSAGASDQI